jgi:hypothetical protein
MIMVFIGGLLLGIILGWITLWSYLSQSVGRFIAWLFMVLARIFSVLALGLGVLTLVWGIIAGATRQNVRFPSDPGLRSIFDHWGEVVATGAGFLTAGVVTLILSFLGQERAVAGYGVPPGDNRGPAVGEPAHRPETLKVEERPAFVPRS